MNLSRSQALVLTFLSLATTAGGVSIETASVGNPGNAPNSRNHGSVNYKYEVSKFEVTAGQYTAFLNGVARADAYGLYNPNMDTAVDPMGCNILQTGEPGAYSYSVASDWANRPVNYVSWGDAVRFANWMHNGQPTTGVQDLSTTEDGSYFLNGATSDETLLDPNLMREPDATWVLPTRDEWTKAAYHKNDGVTGNYWFFPTSSDTDPSNVLGEPVDPGNNATFSAYPNPPTVGAPYWRTEVAAHENSASPYGTFDQGGNVREWTETWGRTVVGPSRAVLGGSFAGGAVTMVWTIPPAWSVPSAEDQQTGFRLALVPEPGSALIFCAAIGLLSHRRRKP